jgi:hypothetical protein
MYRDTAHNVIQYVNTRTNPIQGGGCEGCVSERVNLSDWEGAGSVGNVSHGDSNMAWETLAVLSCLENPGIYLRTDKETLLVLDHVEAQVVKRDAKGVTLKVTNPTSYPARVSIFAEDGSSAKRPLGWNAFTKWPRIELAAGKSGLYRISRNGEKVTPEG